MPGYYLPVEIIAVFRDAFQALIIAVDKPEAFTVAVCPFKIIHDRPQKIPFQFDTVYNNLFAHFKLFF